jgi:tetratricopeptide (TPR) repeat protein
VHACAECGRSIGDGAPTCPHCGAAAAGPTPRRGRPFFWVFVAALALAVAGGGSIVLLVQRTARERAARFREATAESRGTAPPAPAATPVPASFPARARALDLCARAEARRAARDLDGAIRLYLAAEEADPGLAEIQERLGDCYRLRGDRRQAAERYRRYLATGPADADRVRANLSTVE